MHQNSFTVAPLPTVPARATGTHSAQMLVAPYSPTLATTLQTKLPIPKFTNQAEANQDFTLQIFTEDKFSRSASRLIYSDLSQQRPPPLRFYPSVAFSRSPLQVPSATESFQTCHLNSSNQPYSRRYSFRCFRFHFSVPAKVLSSPVFITLS